MRVRFALVSALLAGFLFVFSASAPAHVHPAQASAEDCASCVWKQHAPSLLPAPVDLPRAVFLVLAAPRAPATSPVSLPTPAPPPRAPPL